MYRLRSCITGPALLALIIVLAAFSSACGGGAVPSVSHSTGTGSRSPAKTTSSCPHTGAPVGDGMITVVPYFADRRGWYAVPEFREVAAKPGLGVEALAEVVVEQLLAGPEDPTLLPVLPAKTTLRNVEFREGTLFVDVSREFVAGQPGGSLWELLVLRSITNSLFELEGVEQVQLLVDGQKVESLAGHLAIDVPLVRDPVETGPTLVDFDRQEVLQEQLDSGAEEWRQSPDEAVCREARLFGFTGREEYELVYFDRGQPEVRTPLVIYRVNHDGIGYLLTLVQPIKTGPGGIWAIIDVREQP